MPKRSTLQQRVVFHIQKMSSDGALVQESVLFPDRSIGVDREVDVVITKNVGEHEVIICIECTDSDRKATITWIEQIAMKHNFLPTSKLVLISRSGFTKSAQEKANFFGIDTYSFENSQEIDWKDILGEDSTLGFNLWAFRIIGCNMILAENENTVYSVGPDVPVYDSTHALAGTISEFVRKHTERSSKFTENAIEFVQKEGGPVFGGEIRMKSSLFVKGENERYKKIKAIRALFEARKPDSAFDLQSMRYRGNPVAYGKGKTPVGNCEITLFQTKDAQPEGLMSVTNPKTGNTQTVGMQFQDGDGKVIFLTESVDAKAKKG